MIQGINQLDDLRYLQNLAQQLSRDILYMNTAMDTEKSKNFLSWLVPNKEFPNRSDIYKNSALETREMLESAWRDYLMYYKDTIDPEDPEIQYIRHTLDKSVYL